MPQKNQPEQSDPSPSARKMEDMLWHVACELRGNVDAPKYKNYILPLIFLKRLSDVFDDEIARLAKKFGGSQNGLQMAEIDHKLVRFFLPSEARWEGIRQESPWTGPAALRPNSLGERLNFAMRAVAENNPPLRDVVNINDFNASSGGVREVDDNSLRNIIARLSEKKFRLGTNDVEPDFLGRTYEYLLDRFAEGSGKKGGEHFTPPAVGRLMARIVRPQPGETVHDFACGSGGLLIKCELALRQAKPNNQIPLKLFGQEISGDTFALARMNAILHGMDAEILRGDTMLNPKFRQNDGALQQFDIVVANPMWNQAFPAMEDDPFARFQNRGGNTPGNADWTWLQHTMAALNPQSGRAAVVLDTGAMTRSGAQKNIRKWFVQNDIVDSVILLPDNLFYNTSAAGIIIILRARKPRDRRGKITLINAANLFTKVGAKNRITDECAQKIADAVAAGKNIEHFTTIVDAEVVANNEYNILPSRYVDIVDKEKIRPVSTIWRDLQKLREQERKTDTALSRVVTRLAARKSVQK